MNRNSLIPRDEFCRLLGLNPRTLRDWENTSSPRYKPELPKVIPLGARIRCYLASEVETFIEQQAAKARKVGDGK